MLLATVGMTALGYVHDLNMPTSLDDNSITFDFLAAQLRTHYGEKTSQLAARNEFSRVLQKDGQTVDEFAAGLRTATLHCQFGAELDVRLRDQLLFGLQSEPIRKRIMERDTITFAEALKLAGDLERISREAKLGGAGEASVSKVTSTPRISQRTIINVSQPSTSRLSSSTSRGGNQTGSRGACWSCGDTDHFRVNCFYVIRGLKCRECGEVGHKAKVCPLRPKLTPTLRNSTTPQTNRQQNRGVNANAVDGQQASGDVTINTVQSTAQT